MVTTKGLISDLSDFNIFASPYKEIFVIFHRRLQILPEFCHNVSRLEGDRDILALSMVCSACLKPLHDFSIFGEKVEGAAVHFGDAPRHQNVAVVETPDLWSHANKPGWGPYEKTRQKGPN